MSGCVPVVVLRLMSRLCPQTLTGHGGFTGGAESDGQVRGWQRVSFSPHGSCLKELTHY